MVLLHQITSDMTPSEQSACVLFRAAPRPLPLTMRPSPGSRERSGSIIHGVGATRRRWGYLAEHDGFLPRDHRGVSQCQPGTRGHLAATWVDPMYRRPGVGRTILVVVAALGPRIRRLG